MREYKINNIIQRWIDGSRFWDGKVSNLRMNLGLADEKFGREDFGVLEVEEVIC